MINDPESRFPFTFQGHSLSGRKWKWKWLTCTVEEQEGDIIDPYVQQPPRECYLSTAKQLRHTDTYAYISMHCIHTQTDTDTNTHTDAHHTYRQYYLHTPTAIRECCRQTDRPCRKLANRFIYISSLLTQPISSFLLHYLQIVQNIATVWRAIHCRHRLSQSAPP